MSKFIRCGLGAAAAVLILVGFAWLGSRTADKVDTVVARVLELRAEHDRLCMMHGLFGPLAAGGIRPDLFPLCRRTHETLTHQIKEENGP